MYLSIIQCFLDIGPPALELSCFALAALFPHFFGNLKAALSVGAVGGLL